MINPSKNPEINPPICAELSTWGNIPTAKFITIMITKVNKAASYRKDGHIMLVVR